MPPDEAPGSVHDSAAEGAAVLEGPAASDDHAGLSQAQVDEHDTAPQRQSYISRSSSSSSADDYQDLPPSPSAEDAGSEAGQPSRPASSVLNDHDETGDLERTIVGETPSELPVSQSEKEMSSMKLEDQTPIEPLKKQAEPPNPAVSSASKDPEVEAAASITLPLTSTGEPETDSRLNPSSEGQAQAELATAQHRPSAAGSFVSTQDGVSSFTTPTIIYGVVLVAFNHALGPIVEYSYPSDLKDDTDIKANLPFLALPDGAHLRDEDYSCFHLYLPNISDSTVYGISCIRQLRADELVKKAADVTRSTVQKAVVVLANKPVFGPIRDKLGVITRAFFAQKDFGDTEILDHFYGSLGNALQDEDQTSESAIYMGISLREFIWKFRLQTLILFKLMLLQKKVMFWGSQVERLCAFQYSLVSLVPFLLMNLEDAAYPALDSRSHQIAKSTSLKTSDRKSLLSYIGLPLNLFGKDAFFQPYLPLQQIDLLKTKSYLVGTTNSIIQQQRDCQIDVIVNIETASIDFNDPKIASLVNLTAADRKWMDDIVRAVKSTWNPSDPQRPMGMGFKASDDWLRSKFEEYICSALSAIKFIDYLSKNKNSEVLINKLDPSSLASFNESWLAAFRSTHAFEIWDSTTDPVIFDLVEPRHPCEGQAHLIEDVGIRLVNGLHDLHLDEKLGPTQEAISKGIATGSEGVWRVYSNLKADLARRQAEYAAKREKELKEQREKERTEGLAAPSTKSPDKEKPETETELLSPTAGESQNQLASQVLAGAADAGGKAASLAVGFGSFLGARISKAKSQVFAAQAASEASTSSTGGAPPVAPPLPPRRSSESTSTSGETNSLSPAPTTRPRTSFFSTFRAAAPVATNTRLPSHTEAPSYEDEDIPPEFIPRSLDPPEMERTQIATPLNPQPQAAPASPLSPPILGSLFKRAGSGSGSSFLGAFGRSPSNSTQPPASPPVSSVIGDTYPPKSGTANGPASETGASMRNEATEVNTDIDSSRKSLSMGSDRSSVDMMRDMKDVKL